jgi:hypothetical protein
MNGLPPLPSPGGYERACAESAALAFGKLGKADLAELCRKSGASPVDADTLRLPFLNREYLIDRRAGSVSPAAGAEPLPMAERLLLLHYLVTAKGTPGREEMISFQELPEGVAYQPTFYKRAIRPLLNRFGAAPAEFIAAAAAFGGVAARQGDASVTIQVFPRVAMTWIIWRGDDEFPAAGTILVDRGIPDYLPVEDIAVLCQSIAMKWCRR